MFLTSLILFSKKTENRVNFLATLLYENISSKFSGKIDNLRICAIDSEGPQAAQAVPHPLQAAYPWPKEQI